MNIITSVRGSEVTSNLEFKKFIEALGVKFMKFNLAIQYKDKNLQPSLPIYYIHINEIRFWKHAVRKFEVQSDAFEKRENCLA